MSYIQTSLSDGHFFESEIKGKYLGLSPLAGDLFGYKECRKTYSGELILAEDFMTVDFG